MSVQPTLSLYIHFKIQTAEVIGSNFLTDNICIFSVNILLGGGVTNAEIIIILLSTCIHKCICMCIEFSRYNGQARDAMKAVEGINVRAAYDLLPDVLLVRSDKFGCT